MSDERAVADVLSWLERKGSSKQRDGMARFAIPSDAAYGVSVGDLRAFAKTLGRSQPLAEALWRTGKYEARMLATFVGEPDRVTPRSMDAWCRDFDNWAICDTACFALFDRSPHAAGRVVPWSRRKGEYQKRAAFALIASIAQHEKQAADDAFVRFLPVIEEAAVDSRNFVKKGVSWALRGIGERSPALHARALAVARRLADSEPAPARWVGRDALRQLAKPAVLARLKKRAKK